MATLNPYLTFDGNAREAMEFYREVFGGELTISTFGEFGAPGGAPADGVMHAHLRTPSGFALMASDNGPGMPFTPGDNFSISLSGPEADELRGYWERLAAGGNMIMPLEPQMWGDEFGMCVDKFGVHWMVDILPASA